MNELLAKLPPWLRPREREVENRLLARIETAVLLAAAVLLAVVAFNDIFWTVQDAGVLVADQQTWRHYTGRDYFNVSAGRLVFNEPIDVSCANSSPGRPGARTQICLIMSGPAVGGLRPVIGGWRLAPHTGNFARNRYACFGAARTTRLCPNG